MVHVSGHLLQVEILFHYQQQQILQPITNLQLSFAEANDVFFCFDRRERA